MPHVEYIEIDSTFRDRTKYPNVGEFTVQLGSSGVPAIPLNMVSPVSLQASIAPETTGDHTWNLFALNRKMTPAIGIGSTSAIEILGQNESNDRSVVRNTAVVTVSVTFVDTDNRTVHVRGKLDPSGDCTVLSHQEGAYNGCIFSAYNPYDPRYPDTTSLDGSVAQSLDDIRSKIISYQYLGNGNAVIVLDTIGVDFSVSLFYQVGPQDFFTEVRVVNTFYIHTMNKAGISSRAGNFGTYACSAAGAPLNQINFAAGSRPPVGSIVLDQEVTSFTGPALPANTYVCGITTDADNVEIVSILVCSPAAALVDVTGITAIGFVVSITRVPESSGELYVPDGIDADLGYASRFVVNETRQQWRQIREYDGTTHLLTATTDESILPTMNAGPINRWEVHDSMSIRIKPPAPFATIGWDSSNGGLLFTSRVRATFDASRASITVTSDLVGIMPTGDNINVCEYTIGPDDSIVYNYTRIAKGTTCTITRTSQTQYAVTNISPPTQAAGTRVLLAFSAVRQGEVPYMDRPPKTSFMLTRGRNSDTVLKAGDYIDLMRGNLFASGNGIVGKYGSNDPLGAVPSILVDAAAVAGVNPVLGVNVGDRVISTSRGNCSVEITAAGTGYTVGPASTTAATGSGLTVFIESVGGAGDITAVTVVQCGSGYSPGDVVTVLQNGSGNNATLTIGDYLSTQLLDHTTVVGTKIDNLAGAERLTIFLSSQLTDTIDPVTGLPVPVGPATPPTEGNNIEFIVLGGLSKPFGLRVRPAPVMSRQIIDAVGAGPDVSVLAPTGKVRTGNAVAVSGLGIPGVTSATVTEQPIVNNTGYSRYTLTNLSPVPAILPSVGAVIYIEQAHTAAGVTQLVISDYVNDDPAKLLPGGNADASMPQSRGSYVGMKVRIPEIRDSLQFPHTNPNPDPNVQPPVVTGLPVWGSNPEFNVDSTVIAYDQKSRTLTVSPPLAADLFMPRRPVSAATTGYDGRNIQLFPYRQPLRVSKYAKFTGKLQTDVPIGARKIVLPHGRSWPPYVGQASTKNGEYTGMYITLGSSVSDFQTRLITGYDAASRTVVFDSPIDASFIRPEQATAPTVAFRGKASESLAPTQTTVANASNTTPAANEGQSETITRTSGYAPTAADVGRRIARITYTANGKVVEHRNLYLGMVIGNELVFIYDDGPAFAVPSLGADPTEITVQWGQLYAAEFRINSGVVSDLPKAPFPLAFGIPATPSFQTAGVLQVTRDSDYPVTYTGSLINQMTCYTIELVNIVLPNAPLDSGAGGRIAFYPFVYVQLQNETAPSSGNQINFYSNNPNSRTMVWRVPIDDVYEPETSPFIKLNCDGQAMTVKFNPNDNLKFSVRLPNGEVFKTTLEKDADPELPNPFAQISLMVRIMRLSP